MDYAERTTKRVVNFDEPIRLIIWDLDETFWHGTLTEGGITYRADCHELVVTLAKRGIMSAICSKNEMNSVKVILQEKGLWNYIVFPSVDWTPKGPRVKDIIEQMGLRAASVLFIDDNPQNLNQASAMSPGLNTCPPDIIPFLLGHDSTKGKDDQELSRLKQYKVLEQKQSIKQQSGDNISFLRASNVRVYFDYDTIGNIDRVIELINRTNQLNFTKLRVSDDLKTARQELIPFLNHPGTTSALVRVVDDYGDYGYVGFYAFTELSAQFYLKHFCFSCRTLNMYIEHFVYDFIGRPHLEVVGEVLSDIQDTDIRADWIQALPIENFHANNTRKVKNIDRMFVRGGCDLMSLCHYFSMNCREITTEFNDIKNWQPRRLDHSSFLLHSLNGLTDDQLAAAQWLGYDSSDFKTELLSMPANVYLLSFWADADITLYRHKVTGLDLPYALTGANTGDLTKDDKLVEKVANRPVHFERIDTLRREWEYLGALSGEAMDARYRTILDLLPSTAQVFMTLANERPPEYFWQEHKPLNERHIIYNQVLRNIKKDFKNLQLVDPSPYIKDYDDLLDVNHFRRDIYHRIYTDILNSI